MGNPKPHLRRFRLAIGICFCLDMPLSLKKRVCWLETNEIHKYLVNICQYFVNICQCTVLRCSASNENTNAQKATTYGWWYNCTHNARRSGIDREETWLNLIILLILSAGRLAPQTLTVRAAYVLIIISVCTYTYIERDVYIYIYQYPPHSP